MIWVLKPQYARLTICPDQEHYFYLCHESVPVPSCSLTMWPGLAGHFYLLVLFLSSQSSYFMLKNIMFPSKVDNHNLCFKTISFCPHRNLSPEPPCSFISLFFFIHFKCFKNFLPLGQGFSKVHLELLKTGYAAGFCL